MEYIKFVKGEWLQAELATYVPLTGAAHAALPAYVANKKAIVKIQNHDERCFEYAIPSALHPQAKHNRHAAADGARWYGHQKFRSPQCHSAAAFAAANWRPLFEFIEPYSNFQLDPLVALRPPRQYGCILAFDVLVFWSTFRTSKQPFKRWYRLCDRVVAFVRTRRSTKIRSRVRTHVSMSVTME